MMHDCINCDVGSLSLVARMQTLNTKHLKAHQAHLALRSGIVLTGLSTKTVPLSLNLKQSNILQITSWIYQM